MGNTAVPLYHRIFMALRDDILSGRAPEGSFLPSEHDLASLHGVSRITARRALDELAKAGLVTRRRRHGTQVSHAAATPAINADLDQALDTLIAFGHDTRVRIVGIATVPASDDAARALAIEPGTPCIEAVRMRDRDGAAIGRVSSHAIAELAAIFTPEKLLGTPLLALVRSAGFGIGGAHETISARAADPEMADLLGIEWRAPLLVIERLVIDESGRPLLRTIAEYRADQYRIELNLNARH